MARRAVHAAADSVAESLKRLAPPLDGTGHKGQGGRIGIYGGSKDFTGAPYFAGMAAMRSGAELVHVYTCEEALLPIKSYSPELMVSDISRSRDALRSGANRLKAICAGCGLGAAALDLRSDVAKDLNALVALGTPIVLDADAAKWAAQQPDAVRSRENVILTPNVPEFAQLAKAVLGEDADLTGDDVLEKVTEALAGPVVIQKGRVDQIHAAGMSQRRVVDVPGSRKRPGGIGDILAGCTTLLVSWASAQSNGNGSLNSAADNVMAEACQVAATLVRRAAFLADKRRGRALVASDILDDLGSAFEDLETGHW